MQTVKIAVIGAGSRSFAPGIVRDILLSQPLAERQVSIALMDTVPAHLIDIEGYARQLTAQLGRHVSITATTDLDAAIDGASSVITAIEVDRYKYWAQDYHIPRKYGFRQVYGENGGPGGLFHALRNMGPTIEIARAMERLCPEAPLLNFTNPEHKLCEAVCRLTSIKAIGLCHGVFMGLHQIAAILGVPVEDIEGDACGINHFTWFQSIRDRRTGEDLYPRLREAEREGDWLADWHEIGLSRILFRRFGLWPSPAANHCGEYIRWADEFVASELQFFHDPADGKPWETGFEPEFVYSLSGDKTSRPWRKPAANADRMAEAPLEPSGELAIPIVEALACGVQRRLEAVNVPNHGAIPNLPEDMVVEVPANVDVSGLHPARMAPLPEGIAAMLRIQGSIHELLVQAYAEHSKQRLLQALLLDPVVHSYRAAVECLDEMLELQKDLLPEFT